MTGRHLLYAALRSQDGFVLRVVRFLAAEIGVRQFLDVGSGIGDATLLHTVAPRARLVYVTNDPVERAHLHEAFDGGDRGHVDHIVGDLRNPAGVLEHAGATLDLDQPVAVLLSGVLHLLPDSDDHTDASQVVSHLIDAVAAESHLVVTLVACDIHPAEMAAMLRQLNADTADTWRSRNSDQVRGFFAGLDLVDPGVVQVDEWRPAINPNPPHAPDGRISPLWVGVGRKP